MSEDRHKLGEVLREAREAKGVDLPRVERDTKIRTRYLSALEGGDYRDLPGSVYTKGFLRNYGSYLGLDPEYLIDLYRLETSSASSERPRAALPPRPIARRRRALVVTPGAVMAILLTIGVGIFIAYLTWEFLTFAGTPELRITQPAGDVARHTDSTIVVEGVTAPDSVVRVEGAVENPTVTADGDGQFSVELRLRPGPNVIILTARDPVTGRDSEAIRRTVNLVAEEPIETPAPALAMTSPEHGASLSGPITIAGSTAPDATVTVSASGVAAAAPTFTIVTAAGEAVELPPAAVPEPPDPLTINAAADGSFTAEWQLPPGHWQLLVAPGIAEADATELEIIITPPAGLSGTLLVDDAPSYLEIDEDGQLMEDISGRNAAPGDRIDLAAQETIRVRAGNASAVRVVINGIEVGPMGGPGAVVEWQIRRE
jgi:cytoskeletal protein RodZ